MLSVFYTNAASLHNKMQELQARAAASSPDVLAISETWGRCGVMDAELAVAGYRLFRKDRADGRKGGGVAIMVKDTIPAVSHPLPDIPVNDVVACDIGPPESRLTVICVYRPPGWNPRTDPPLLALLASLFDSPLRFVLVGDLNAGHVNWDTLSCGGPSAFFDTKLVTLVQDSLVFQHVRAPTRHRSDAPPSLLDVIITKDDSDVSNVKIEDPLGLSDHSIIQFQVEWRLRVTQPITVKRLYRKVDWDQVLECAAALDWTPTAITDPSALWLHIKELILELDRTFVPTKLFKPSLRPIWFRRDVRRAFQKKRALFLDYARLPSHLTYSRYIQGRNRAETIKNRKKAEYENSIACDAKNNKKRLFAYAKSFTRLSTRSSVIRLADGSLSNSPLQSATHFSKYFASTYRTDDLSPPPIVPACQEVMPPIEITPAMVSVILANLNPSKSPGPDGIHPSFLKMLAPLISKPLATLFSLSLSSGRVPDDWRRAVVTPLLKKGSPAEVSNYRPISLTSITCKVLERIVRDALTAHLRRQHLLHDAQHGFVTGRSCLTNLLSTLNMITQLMDNGEDVDMCFLDFSKAFDIVNHRIICAKLTALGVSPEVVGWVRSFLANRTFQVRIDDVVSDSAAVPSGVPQGSVIGPLLFLVMVNDLPNEHRLFCRMFADDTKLGGRSDTVPSIQLDLDRTADWTRRNCMHLNAAKSQHLHFGRNACPNLVFPDPTGVPVPIPQAQSVKDLGILIDSSLSPTAQIDAAVTKSRGMLAFIKRTFKRLTPQLFIPLYSAMVRPHLEYCVQAWAPHLIRDIAKLEKVQEIATRCVPALRHLSYPERLNSLKLFSLRRRRLRGDLIETFKILRGFISVDPSEFFSLRESRDLRGHPLMLAKPRVNTSIRQNFFAVRVVNHWNKLPSEVVLAPSINSFKSQLDKAWSSLFPGFF